MKLNFIDNLRFKFYSESQQSFKATQLFKITVDKDKKIKYADEQIDGIWLIR